MVDEPATGTQPVLPQYLEDARIASVPYSAFYIPNFITEQEEELILSKVVERLFRCTRDHADAWLLP